MGRDNTDNSGKERTRLDARRTGWSIDDILNELEKWGDDPENQYYYTTYSDVIHTSPECPHIQDSERLHYAGMPSSLNGPYSAGAHRFTSEMDECSWCEEMDSRTSD